MIASSGKFSRPPTVSRHYEFSRLHAQILAFAYEELIPIAPMWAKRPHTRAGDLQRATTRTEASRSSAAGA
jgi:hypothetical protein